MTLAAGATIHLQFIADSRNTLEHLGHVARNANRGEDPLCDFAAFNLMPIVTGDLNAPTLWIFHTGGTLAQKDTVIHLSDHLLQCGGAGTEEGIAHTCISLTTVILPTSVCRARDLERSGRISVREATAEDAVLHNLSRGSDLTLIIEEVEPIASRRAGIICNTYER